MNARNQNDFLRARSLYHETLQLLQRTQQGNASATLIRLGVVEHDLGNLEAAHGYLSQALTANRKRNNEIGLAISLSKLAYVERDMGSPERAAALWQEALALCRSLGYRHEQGNAALALSQLASSPTEAAALRTEADEAFTATGDTEGLVRLARISLS